VARASLSQRLLGFTGPAWAVVLVAGAGGLLAATRAKSRGPRAAALFAVLFAAGVAAQLNLGARLQSDGFYYFAYLRSLAFDGDVDFANDYRLLGLGDKPHLFTPTATGHAQSAWTIGPAIVWAPFFAGGHVVATVLSRHDPNVDANGISFPYRQAVCVAGLFYGLIGCWFCYRIARRFHDAPVAALATVLVVSGSFMLWYIVKEPSMTHAPSMAAVAGFTWLWLATRGPAAEAPPLRRWALLGAVAGFMTLIRWQNALFALLPACDALVILWRSAGRDRAVFQRTLASGLVFTACAAAAFVPQMLAWKAIYGSFLAVSPVGPQIRWADPHLVDVLWSSRNGLFSWSPVLYIGAAGLVLFAIAQPAAGVPMLVAIAVMTYFNASIQDWWGSAGFGGRRFDGTIPFFCVGMAALAVRATEMTRRHPLRAVGLAGALLVAWNVAMVRVAQDGGYRLGTAVSFGDTSAAQARVLHRWLGNPFTYPASLAFALRNGVSPSAYDLLSGNRFLGDIARPYGRIDIGVDDQLLLREGWMDPEQDGATTFRWATSPAEAIVPLDHAAPLTLQIRLRAFGYAGAPPQTVSATINGQTYGPAPVGTAWETIEFATTERSWRGGLNRVRLDFAWARRPADVGAGGDGRVLAAAVDYIRVAVPAGESR
jgi:hypothetical protein